MNAAREAATDDFTIAPNAAGKTCREDVGIDDNARYRHFFDASTGASIWQSAFDRELGHHACCFERLLSCRDLDAGLGGRGLAAFSHPSNFRSPQPVRLHPTMPYFCFAPMVLGDFAITPGTPYVSRFRFAAFDGPVDEAALQAIWTSYAADSDAGN